MNAVSKVAHEHDQHAVTDLRDRDRHFKQDGQFQPQSAAVSEQRVEHLLGIKLLHCEDVLLFFWSLDQSVGALQQTNFVQN